LLSDHREFPAKPESAQEARAHALEMADRWGVAADGLASVVTELVVNAIVHAGGRFTLFLCLDGGVFIVEVADPSTDLPETRTPADDDPRGRGLVIVEALSRDWGVRAGRAGKVIWAELDVDSAERGRTGS
jgi:anti-sigma regulatory factor (Ser/Thr protein kinase)